ncbi:MAG: hypothetical protein QOD75_89 [Blastocatellia bacterium]|jgi:hypothetical protein|nr:hypothetical protein [Blastocatellia bacterium]
MSSHQDSFQIPVPPEHAKALCAQAITSLGLPITGDLGYALVCGESFKFGFTWPVTMNVQIDRGDGSMSRITIGGSNFGFGPIQSSHVRKRVFALRERIEMMAQQPAAPTPSAHGPAPAGPQPSAPVSQVIVNGVRLRDDEVNALEQKYHSQIPDGSYWYDKMCGAWGMQGGPVLCTIEPNLALGGPLQANASNGATGVFINGRELHYLDIALVQRVVPMIIPGRWWLDVYGNFGSEGGPMLGNLWDYAKAQDSDGENRSSVLSSWDRTGVAVFSG